VVCRYESYDLRSDIALDSKGEKISLETLVKPEKEYLSSGERSGWAQLERGRPCLVLANIALGKNYLLSVIFFSCL